MRILRPQREVLNDWVHELAEKLNRSVDKILKEGLNAYDFSPGNFIEIRQPYGVVTRISFAFALVKPEQKLAAVFSEHSGYLEFDLEEDASVIEIREEIIYRQEGPPNTSY